MKASCAHAYHVGTHIMLEYYVGLCAIAEKKHLQEKNAWETTHARSFRKHKF
jgi:hypothetical protein